MRRLRCRFPFEAWDCTVCGRRQDRPPHSYLTGLACLACIDRGRRGEPFIPLTIRPTAPRSELEARQMVAVCMRQGVCVTEQGELFDLAGLAERVRERLPGELGRTGPNARLRRPLPDQLPPCFIVTDHGLDLLGYLDHSPAADSPMWQWQGSLRAQSAWRPEAKAPKRRAEFLVPRPVRFGYPSRVEGKRKKRARWYELLDVSCFCELPEGWGSPDAAELLRFGLELRAWANANRLPVLTSASAYGGRLLRDARFGGGWRRKVPAATNRQLRRRLPGNHYQLLGAAEQTHQLAHKLDQHAAHHYAALHTAFPHPDELRADGWFRREPPRDGARATTRGAIPRFDPRWDELIRRPGVFTLAVYVKGDSITGIDALSIPALRHNGTRWRTITSVELAHIRALQAQGQRIGLGDIWSCWTSPATDERLNEYAWWAGERLVEAEYATKRWLKPALLAAYGLLAAKPRRYRNVWRWCTDPDGGFAIETRYGTLAGFERSTKRERESQTANVLWRCLIESRVRLESLTYAQALRADGFKPLAVYADAVFAAPANGRPQETPHAPAPWRYEGVIHDLVFETPARYRSREETRLPGTPRRRGGLRDPFTGRTNPELAQAG